ncbi:MAG: glycine cleavage system aminomethyltransferase GcvT [Phycisphaeraceae bacterium]
MLRTAFYQFHLDRGGKMVDFAGWEMPLHYGSILDEHHAVRNGVGIFDVSHMGRIYFGGRHARRFLERICTRRISDMEVGQCRYSLVCNEQGGVKDDVLVYRFDNQWLMVCNASNREKLLEHFQQNTGDLSVKIEDRTQKTAMVALQGPQAMDLIGRFSNEVPSLKRFRFVQKNLLILKLAISRTGYTGEDGVEVIMPANMIQMAIKLFLKDGDGESKVVPVGLGARDTLRLEAGLPLYGHELTEEINPLEAGLGFAVSLDKDTDDQYGEPEPFIGQPALQKVAADGPTRKLVGLKLEGKRTARQHMTVRSEGKTVGEITSGCLSPTLGYSIAMALVDQAHGAVGTTLNVDLGSNGAAAEVVKLPFYKKG